MQSDPEAQEPGVEEAAPAFSAGRKRAQAWIPAFAVAAVAVAAVVTALMVTQGDPEQDGNRLAQATKTQGAAPGCRDCGVVESVVALDGRPQTAPAAYRLRIRMDDGSVRMVEQSGVVVAGARVMVTGGSARPLGRAVPG